MNFKNKIFFIVLALMVVSCNKVPLPWEQYEDMEHGAFARGLTNDGVSFFLTDVAGSSTTFTVEFYDENQGKDVASFDWYVRHRNKVAGTTSAQKLIVSKSSSEFTPNAKSGLPSTSYTLTLANAVSALGISIDDLNGGDDLIFDGIITMNDGRTFGADNTDTAVNGGAGFDGLFRIVKPLLCASGLAGTYSAVSTGAGPWGCTNSWAGQVELVKTGDGEYDIFAYDADHVKGSIGADFSMGAYWVCYGGTATLPGGTLKLIDACNNLAYKGASRWGEVYSFNEVTVAGSDLTLDWVNDYGEGGVTTLTRTDGTNWPALKK